MGTKIKTYFISDLHFSHEGILTFHPKRKELAGITDEEMSSDIYNAVNKHDEWLIDLWNSSIRRCDIIYILGDICLKNKERTEKILQRLHGRKFLIRGNHDKSCNGLERYFEWVGDIKEVKFTYNQYEFINPDETFCVELCHFPLLTWNRRPHGTIMVHGHCHGGLDKINIESGELRVDAGLDAMLANYKFIDLETLYSYFKDIISKADCKTFHDYNEYLMKKQGVRL